MIETIAASLFVLIAEFTVIPEKRDEFVAISTEQVETVRNFDGNVQFDVLIDPERPDTVMYFERWQSAEQQAAFYAWWVEQGLTEKLGPLVTAAPIIRAFEQVSD